MLALVLGIAPQPATQPAPRPFELTVDSIMRGARFVGHPPEKLRWSGDSRELLFVEEETSWADEYRRIPKLFETHVRER